MNLMTDPRIRAGVARAFSALFQGVATALHHGSLSTGAGYLILAVGVACCVGSVLLRQVGVLLVGDSMAREIARFVERLAGVVVVAFVVLFAGAHLLGH